MARTMAQKSIHATLVSIKGEGVLILGEPGAGKSDLALRLMDEGASLVADDRVELFEHKGALRGRAPEKLRGLIELRGAGIAAVKSVADATIRLAVILSPRRKIERLPDAQPIVLAGHDACLLPALRLCGFDASATARIRLALSQAARVRKEKKPRIDAPGIWDIAADAVMVPARARTASKARRAAAMKGKQFSVP